MAKKPKLAAKIVLAVFLAAQFTGLSLLFPKKLDSANLTSVKDTLSDNRLSFVGALASGNTVGTSLVTIATDLSSYGWATSDENFNLFPGDTLMIGATTNYEVDDIIDDATDDKIQLTAVLASGDADTGDPVIATRSATHTLTFNTATAVNNGAFRVRVKGTSANGIPDKDGFDYSAATWAPATDLSCSNSGGTYNFGMKTATASGGTGCTAGYHCFECRYNGAGGIGNTITFTIGSAAKLINPSPSAETKTIGAADTYAVIVEHMDSANTVTDATTAKVAVVEAVRVTATVEPTIEFAIAARTTSDTNCGGTNDITSTASTVPLGTLYIAAFIDAGQKLTVSTNAPSGYAVTSIEDDELSIGGEGTTIIADSAGDGGTMDHDTSGDWDDPTDTDGKGFGYSLENVDAANVDLSYTYTGANCSGESTTYCARHFANAGDTQSSQRIFYSSSTANAEDVYVCYRAVISSTQAAGDYENRVTYIATATF